MIRVESWEGMRAREMMAVLHECVKVFVGSFSPSSHPFPFGTHATSVDISNNQYCEKRISTSLKWCVVTVLHFSSLFPIRYRFRQNNTPIHYHDNTITRRISLGSTKYNPVFFHLHYRFPHSTHLWRILFLRNQCILCDWQARDLCSSESSASFLENHHICVYPSWSSSHHIQLTFILQYK